MRQDRRCDDWSIPVNDLAESERSDRDVGSMYRAGSGTPAWPASAWAVTTSGRASAGRMAAPRSRTTGCTILHPVTGRVAAKGAIPPRPRRGRAGADLPRGRLLPGRELYFLDPSGARSRFATPPGSPACPDQPSRDCPGRVLRPGRLALEPAQRFGLEAAKVLQMLAQNPNHRIGVDPRVLVDDNVPESSHVDHHATKAR